MGKCKIALSSADFYYYGKVNRKDLCKASQPLVPNNGDGKGKIAFNNVYIYLKTINCIHQLVSSSSNLFSYFRKCNSTKGADYGGYDSRFSESLFRT